MPAADPPSTLREKIRKSGNLIPVGVLIVFIVAVLITGYATATECAAYGVVGSLGLALWSRSLTWQNFKEGLMGTTRTSCMIMFILAGAAFLTKTMAFTGIPRELAEWVNAMHLSPFALISVLVIVYLVLGTAGARTEMPGCSLCMGNQAQVREGATVISTSTRNFPNRLGKNTNVFLGSAELAAIASRLGYLPSKEEYLKEMGVIDADKASVYRYMNFDQIEEYAEAAKAAPASAAVAC
ncbi:TRAP transporter large permease subunit [Acidovorax sp. NPDC077664]|uniref:TRAP transporter large permease subunit n=1 Tax=Acidovorax sp. NPDC077664 TaxID=3390544 RepID=UPI003CFDAC4D